MGLLLLFNPADGTGFDANGRAVLGLGLRPLSC